MNYKVSEVQKTIIYIVFIVSVVGIVLLLLPVWNIETIQIENTNYYTEDEILSSANIEQGMHILSISKEKSIENINKLPYIKSADIKFNFPNSIEILVKENIPLGYVPFNGTYLCLDENGQVLGQSDKMKVSLPIIEGLRFRKFQLYDKLPIENDDNFIVVTEIVNTLRKYDFLDKVDSIDISNIEQIHLYVDKLDVIIGNIREFDKKIMWLVQVYQDYSIGILDLSMIHLGQAILTPLT